MLPRDSIVEDVRAVRDAIAKEFDYDIDRLRRALQERQTKSGRPVVRLPPRRIPPEKKSRVMPGEIAVGSSVHVARSVRRIVSHSQIADIADDLLFEGNV